MEHQTKQTMKTYKFLLFVFAMIIIFTACKKPEEDITGIIQGTVTNAQTLDPIKGAIVTINTSSSITTGDDGMFRFENLEAKTHVIQVKANGYETNTKSINAIAGQIIPGDISLTPLVPILGVSATNLNFGMNLTLLPITISNTGKNTLNWTISENISWLSVNPASGANTSESGSVNVLIDRTGLSAKVYTQNIIINSNGGSATIDISMIVQGPVPTAILTVSPPAGSLSQSFQVDATGSIDDIDPGTSLFVRWRWEDGGAFTDWTTIKTSLHQYLSEGSKNITLEVKDSDGHVGTVTKSVLVSNSLQLPYVTTLPVTNIIGTTAQCGGNVTTDGGSEIIARGVCWSKNQNPSIFDTKTFETGGLGEFISYLTGLTAGSTYYVRAYATNSQGPNYGNQCMFIAGQNGSAPTVTTEDVTNITSTTAKCGGTVSSDGGSDITARGVCWNTSSNPTTANSKTNDGIGTGNYSSNITGLTANTTYYVRAYATNSIGTSYGSEIVFTTGKLVTIPVVTTSQITSIIDNTAHCGGSVIADGGADVTSRGVCWSSTNSTPNINDPHTHDGSGLGSYTSLLTGLNNSTTYYYRAYAENSAGTGYGQVVQFTTNGSYPGVATLDITNISATSTVVGGAVLNAGEGTVTERGVCWSLGVNPTIYNSKKTSGTGLGGFTVAISDLIPNTTYNVRAYGINSNGAGYGENKSFITGDACYTGFETGLPPEWSSNGWSVTNLNAYEGFFSLMSNTSQDSVKLTRTFINPGSISFYHMSDGDIYGGYGGDLKTEFSIDGNPPNIMHDEGWTSKSFSVSAGIHTFKWKNLGGGHDNNITYIDYVICTGCIGTE